MQTSKLKRRWFEEGLSLRSRQGSTTKNSTTRRRSTIHTTSSPSPLCRHQATDFVSYNITRLNHHDPARCLNASHSNNSSV
mmetsp:Transcript_46575/g.80236  ORF Transcript_46575/g.80236 Transcript_46575/m.80236 type:complete len:81 (-) Transcript_46575:26-268(-)